MLSIIIKPEGVWGYFQRHKLELKEAMHLIAKDEALAIKIYVTEEKGFPEIILTDGDIEVYKENTENSTDCCETVSTIYDDYKEYVGLGEESYALNDELPEEYIILEREEELDDAFTELMLTILDEQCDPGVMEDIKEHVLEYIARKHKLEIWRPMYLEDENGQEFYEEYPYECMEFEDEDNPIYQ